jgi:hypothetical protein
MHTYPDNLAAAGAVATMPRSGLSRDSAAVSAPETEMPIRDS